MQQDRLADGGGWHLDLPPQGPLSIGEAKNRRVRGVCRLPVGMEASPALRMKDVRNVRGRHCLQCPWGDVLLMYRLY